jgi:uncharacterized damage-inducible protein DinB
MSATLAQISFAELLDWNESGTKKWRAWFESQPASVLELPIKVAGTKNVREFLVHILLVELRYAQRLTGQEITPYEAMQSAGVPEIFDAGDRARAIYRECLATATDEALRHVLEFPTRSEGTFRASERKIFLHAMLHSVRHWAQLATALREAGYETKWGKDFLFAEVME